MNDLIVASSNGTVTMSSIELVDFINNHRIDGEAELQHKNFLAKVPVVLGQNQSAEFLADYRDARGRAQKCYRFPKREACLMAMSYSYDLQAKVFDRMTELESRQHVTIPQSYAEALLEAGRLAKITEEQAAQLAIAAPKAEFVDKYVEATGLKGFRQVAKLLKANEARFREFLIDKKIMYRLGGEWHAYQNHIDAGRFDVKTGSSDSGHAFNQTKFTPKGVNWIAGLWAQYNLQEVA